MIINFLYVQCHIVAEITSKNWGTMPSSMVRKSIRKPQCNSEVPVNAGNSKSDISKSIESIDLECEPYECSTKDIEVVKDLTSSTLKKCKFSVVFVFFISFCNVNVSAMKLSCKDIWYSRACIESKTFCFFTP